MAVTPEAIMNELRNLTNLSEVHARYLVATAVKETWSYDDLGMLIDRAEEEEKITPLVAVVATMAFMTPLPVDRCRVLIDGTRDHATGNFDLYRALTHAQTINAIARRVSRPARLAALMAVDLLTARQYLAETKNDQIHAAIQYMRAGLPCDPAFAETAIFRYLTSFTESQTAAYLARAGSGGVIQAIKLAGDDRTFRSPHEFVIALLRAQFEIDKTDAKMYAFGANNDYTQAMQAVLTDRFMDETMLDRQDARNLLQKTNGNLPAARQLFLQERSKEPLVEAKNGDTRHPPDVQNNTHVIAVCGIPDDAASSASPKRDGWMISDFYLWKHVLEGMGKSQQWLTCEDPFDLVQKYGSIDKYDTTKSTSQISWADGYLHGDPFEERRVVLDKATLSFARKQLCITPHGVALRNEFINRLESTCQKAAKANDHVLVMIFCHGEGLNPKGVDLGGLALGFTPDPRDSPENYFTPSLFQQSLLKTPTVKLSLFTTSCYSGHWVVTPCFKLIKPTAIMAGARPFEESHAWSESASQRHAGGVYSSAFLAELLKEPSESVKELEKAGAPDEIRVYQEFRKDVLSEANRLCIPSKVRMELGSLPLFTTEGEQDPAFKRTGFGLYRYQQNFDKLRRVPASDTNPYRDLKEDAQPSDPRVIDWNKRHPEGDTDYSDRTGGYGQTSRGIRSSVTYMVHRYCTSYPGPKTAPSNTGLHATIQDFRAGMFDGIEHINQVEHLRSQLHYRLWTMQVANQFARLLNLNKVPRIQDFNTEKIDLDLVDLQNENWQVIMPFNLFQPPQSFGNWGKEFRKPARYLAYAFAASGYGPQAVSQMLPKVLERTIKAVSKRKVSAFSESGGERRQASFGAMMKLMSSPRKKQRRSLASAGWMPT
ncbi:MAG: hypothetical protein LQ337_006196 [Flavoplaca oasis]|nr:MAG: hypothetical protein LQ337_006196 [Flavoplaca oasis]